MSEGHGMVNLILEFWGLKVVNAKRIRSAWKLETDQGYKCLKQNNLPPDKSLFVLNLLAYLESKGFTKYERLNLNPDGLPSVTVKGKNFILTDWIEGSELQPKNKKQLKAAGNAYAEFHQASKGCFNRSPKYNYLGQWPKTWDKMLSDFADWENAIRKFGAQNSGEQMFLCTVGYFRDQGKIARQALAKSPYSLMVNKAKHTLPLIHHSCYYQNLIFDKQGNVHLIDFERSRYDLPVHDLAQLINRSARKNKWSIEHGKAILDGYGEIVKLAPEELLLLKLLLAFPYRYWNHCNKYFTNMHEGKWLEKRLAKLVKLDSARQLFLTNCFNA